jgi:hypothetical protein
MTHCSDCGCPTYNGQCTNCDEELFIIDQYEDLNMTLPDDDTEFMKRANSSIEKISKK